jgi:hypothetical protein
MKRVAFDRCRLIATLTGIPPEYCVKAKRHILDTSYLKFVTSLHVKDCDPLMEN